MENSSAAPKTYVKGFHGEDPSTYGNGILTYSRLGQTDMVVSNLGIGGTGFGQIYNDMDLEETKIVVMSAIKAGLNFIDTAPWYGQGKSEQRLGEALRGIPRSAYYLATKVGRYETSADKMFDFTKDTVLKGFQRSLELLKLDYVDVLQLHDAEFSVSIDQLIKHTIPALQELKRQGKTRYVGITGYNLAVLKRIVELSPAGSIDTVLSYCRLNLFNQDLYDFEAFFTSRGVGVINASALGMGLLNGGDCPDWHPAMLPLKEACRTAALICRERGQTIAELALDYSLLQKSIPVTLVGLTSQEQLDMNLAALQKLKDEGTSPEEPKFQDLIKLFKQLPCTHWENIEVSHYWNKLAKLDVNQKADL